MTTIVTMTLDELRALPPLTEEEKRIIRDARPILTDDCPALTADQHRRLRSAKLCHPGRADTCGKSLVHDVAAERA